MAYIDICMHPYFLHYFVLRFKANYPNFAKEKLIFIVMKRIYLYLIIMAACILSSCNLGESNKCVLPKELIQAENIMYENPDSALHILQTMPIPNEKEAHATWALLFTQAKYKCFVNQSDSLVNIAHDYFTSSNNPERNALALYLKGGLLNENNKYEEALNYYLEANKELEKISNDSLGYLIDSHICMIYAYQKLYDYAIEYAWKSNEHAEKSQNIDYIVLSYIRIARATGYINLEKAIEYYEKAIFIADKNNCTDLKATALIEVAGRYKHHQIKRYDESLFSIKEAMKIKETDQSYMVLGDLFRKLNIQDSAYFYLNKAAKSKNIHTSRSAYQSLYYISEKLGHYKKAVEYSNALWECQDSINRMARNQALIEMQEKYNQQKVINEKNKAERRGLIILCISIGIIGMIVACFQGKVLRQNKELEDKRKELGRLQEQLNDNNNKIDQNKERLEMVAEVAPEDVTEELQEKEAVIKNMQQQNENLQRENERLQDKIEEHVAVLQEKSKDSERLNDLIKRNTYLRKRETYLSNQLLKMDKMITNLKQEPDCLKDYQWQELKDKTDYLFDGYTERLMKAVPTLTAHDIRICCLIKLSFNHVAIADILSISPTSLSRQKQRMKERIIQQIGSLGENMLLDIWLKEF